MQNQMVYQINRSKTLSDKCIIQPLNTFQLV